MAKILDRIGETLGLTSRLVDLQKRENLPSNVVHVPMVTPAGVKSRQAELDREAAEAAERAETEKRRLSQLVEITRSLQAEFKKAEQYHAEVVEWLDGFTAQGMKAQAEAIGAGWRQHGGDGANPVWISGLAQLHAVLANKESIRAGHQKVLDEIRQRFAAHIEAHKTDLEELGFYENNTNQPTE